MKQKLTTIKISTKQIPDSGTMLRNTRVCIRTSCSDVVLAFTENCSLEPSAIQLNINTNDKVDTIMPTTTLVIVLAATEKNEK